jgi:hypothetical protein
LGKQLLDDLIMGRRTVAVSTAAESLFPLSFLAHV